MPLELLAHIVSHLKALIRYILEPRGQGYGSTFRVCQALLKSAILLHKEELFKKDVRITVFTKKLC